MPMSMPLERSVRRDQVDWAAYFREQAIHASDMIFRRYYAAGLPEPDTPIAAVPLIALDIETTGLNPSDDGIVSIGMMPFTLRRIRPGDGFYRVLKPRWPLRSRSVTIHRITHTQIEQAPDLDAILPDILEQMAGRVPVVHYRNIERSFLDVAAQLRRHTAWRFPVIDTMALEARWHREPLWSRLKRLLGQEPVSIRLQDSRARYALPPYAAHHALTDALATAELFQAQVAWHFTPDTPLSDLWS